MKTILCIEDEPQMIDLIKLILENQEYRVLGAAGGQQGLKMLRTEKPDLLLLDLMMPDVDDYVTKPFGPRELVESIATVPGSCPAFQKSENGCVLGRTIIYSA
jgi:DNA-binding response OmpR family regulator